MGKVQCLLGIALCSLATNVAAECGTELQQSHNFRGYEFRTTSTVERHHQYVEYKTCVENLGRFALEFKWFIPRLHSWVPSGITEVRSRYSNHNNIQPKIIESCFRYGNLLDVGRAQFFSTNSEAEHEQLNCERANGCPTNGECVNAQQLTQFENHMSNFSDILPTEELTVEPFTIAPSSNEFNDHAQRFANISPVEGAIAAQTSITSSRVQSDNRLSRHAEIFPVEAHRWVYAPSSKGDPDGTMIRVGARVKMEPIESGEMFEHELEFYSTPIGENANPLQIRIVPGSKTFVDAYQISDFLVNGTERFSARFATPILPILSEIQFRVFNFDNDHVATLSVPIWGPK